MCRYATDHGHIAEHSAYQLVQERRGPPTVSQGVMVHVARVSPGRERARLSDGDCDSSLQAL